MMSHGTSTSRYDGLSGRESIEIYVPTPTRSSFWRELLLFMGPGFLMCIAFLDPGNLAADVNQGVAAGYSLLWVTLYGTAMAWVIQCLSARLGVATESHLAELCRAHYPQWASWFLFIAIEVGVIAIDMLETIGGAIAIHGLSKEIVPLWAGVVITCVITFVVLGLQSCGSNFLEYLMAALVGVLSITVAVLFFLAGNNWLSFMYGLVVPVLDSSSVSIATGAIGALIMPHNLFLHSALVLTRDKQIKQVTRTRAITYVNIEAALTLLLSCIVNVMAIAVFAHKFAGVNIEDLGLGNIGEALATRFGAVAHYIWYIGLIASAQASTMTTTYAGQFVMSGFLNLDKDVWWKPLLTRGVTMGPSLVATLLAPSSKDGYEALTNGLNVIDSFVLPFAILPVLVLTRSPAVMGDMVSGPIMWLAGAVVSVFVLCLNLYALATWGISAIPSDPASQILWWFFFTVYILLVLLFVLPPERIKALTHYLSTKNVSTANLAPQSSLGPSYVILSDNTGVGPMPKSIQERLDGMLDEFDDGFDGGAAAVEPERPRTPPKNLRRPRPAATMGSETEMTALLYPARDPSSGGDTSPPT